MRFYIIIALSCCIIGCKESFSPNGVYEKRMVVYSVFDADSTTQYVRLYSTVDPNSYDPLVQLPSNEIAGASVMVKKDTLTYTFHDTLISRQTASGVQSMRVYVHNNLKIVNSQKYTLSIAAPGFPGATSSFIGIGDGYLTQVNVNVFLNASTLEDVSFDLYPGKNVRSCLLIFTLEYEVLRNGIWVKKSYEVPTAYAPQKYFPQITPVVNTNAIRKTFSVRTYKDAIAEIRSNPLDTIHFSQAVFSLHQFDNALYTYYSVANNFPGGTTLRLDEPDYSNVSGGFGIIGVKNTYVRRFQLLQNP